MNTISSSQNSVNAYTQNEKVLKALETAKILRKEKETQDDLIKISQEALQALGNTTQSAANASTENPLSALVNDGTITQVQSDAIQIAFQSTGKAIQSSGVYTSRPKNPIDSLVTSGVITQDQETSIQNALEASMKASKSDTDKSKNTKINPLDSLVSSGIITQDQENSIEGAFEAVM